MQTKIPSQEEIVKSQIVKKSGLSFEYRTAWVPIVSAANYREALRELSSTNVRSYEEYMKKFAGCEEIVGMAKHAYLDRLNRLVTKFNQLSTDEKFRKCKFYFERVDDVISGNTGTIFHARMLLGL